MTKIPILFTKEIKLSLTKFLKRSFTVASTLSVRLYSTAADKPDNSRGYKELIFNVLRGSGMSGW